MNALITDAEREGNNDPTSADTETACEALDWFWFGGDMYEDAYCYLPSEWACGDYELIWDGMECYYPLKAQRSTSEPPITRVRR